MVDRNSNQWQSSGQWRKEQNPVAYNQGGYRTLGGVYFAGDLTTQTELLIAEAGRLEQWQVKEDDEGSPLWR